MIIFNGLTTAQEKEKALTARVAALKLENSAFSPHVAAVLFSEDEGSVLYSNLKQEAATRIGITYTLHQVNITDPTQSILDLLEEINAHPSVTGIIIQKPRRSIWADAVGVQGDPKDIRGAYNAWWELLTSRIDPKKDVDGLHPETFKAIANGSWQEKGKVLPATVKAVCVALEDAARVLGWQTYLDKKIYILGKSDLLGKPISALLAKQGEDQGILVRLFGKAELERNRQQGKFLHDADIVISATGVAGLVKGSDLSQGVVLIDVGEPRPDIDLVSEDASASAFFDGSSAISDASDISATAGNPVAVGTSAAAKAAYSTPVPGGIGPVTVISLMENAVDLASTKNANFA